MFARLAAAAVPSAYLTLMTTPASPDSASRKPVMLTVDDDPAVSRAVARDLRRHYGERLPDRARRIRPGRAGHPQANSSCAVRRSRCSSPTTGCRR